MIEIEDARRAMLRHLAEMTEEFRKVAELRKDHSPREREVLGLGPEDHVPELVIAGEVSIEGDLGWVFFYDSKESVESRGRAGALVGNAPVIISRLDGRLHATGTAYPLELYVESFRKTGDPQAWLRPGQEA